MLGGEHDFSGHRVLVTGATGGLGRRVCVLIAARGGEVVLIARDVPALHELDRSVNRSPGPATRVFPVELADPHLTGATAAEIERTVGPLDGIVLIVPSVPKSDDVLPGADAWRRALDLCFVNPLAILRAALLRASDGARVVIVSGIASVEVFPELPFSNVVRLAWLAEAKTLSFGLARRHIRVNTLSLGGTLTEQFAARVARRMPSDVPERETPETIPLGEYGDPDDAAHVVVTLLGAFASHITGTNIVFDGGLTRRY